MYSPSLVPILLSDDRDYVQQKINHLTTIPQHPSHIQIDIIDGFFANNLTLMPGDLKDIDFHGCTFEIHLMANDPEDYLGECAASGTQAVITQVERLRDRPDFIKVAKQLKLGIGLALDLYTPVNELTDEDLFHADLVLFMSVQAGFSGQAFNPLVIDKIRALRDRGFQKPIEIDGGVNRHNIPSLIKAGADRLAVNSALFEGNVAENLKQLQASILPSGALH